MLLRKRFAHHGKLLPAATGEAVREIVEAAITQATEFELFAPPIENIQTITLREKIDATGMIALKTGKRLGFDLEPHDHDLEMKKD